MAGFLIGHRPSLRKPFEGIETDEPTVRMPVLPCPLGQAVALVDAKLEIADGRVAEGIDGVPNLVLFPETENRCGLYAGSQPAGNQYLRDGQTGISRLKEMTV